MTDMGSNLKRVSASIRGNEKEDIVTGHALDDSLTFCLIFKVKDGTWCILSG